MKVYVLTEWDDGLASTLGVFSTLELAAGGAEVEPSPYKTYVPTWNFKRDSSKEIEELELDTLAPTEFINPADLTYLSTPWNEVKVIEHADGSSTIYDIDSEGNVMP